MAKDLRKNDLIEDIRVCKLNLTDMIRIARRLRKTNQKAEMNDLLIGLSVARDNFNLRAREINRTISDISGEYYDYEEQT